MLAIMPSLAALFSVLIFMVGARDCWIRWLAHRDRSREVDEGLAAAKAEYETKLVEARKHFDQLFGKLEKQNNALASEMVAAKRIVDELNHKVQARDLQRPPTKIAGRPG
jgi:hypothetical protein